MESSCRSKTRELLADVCDWIFWVSDKSSRGLPSFLLRFRLITLSSLLRLVPGNEKQVNTLLVRDSGKQRSSLDSRRMSVRKIPAEVGASPRFWIFSEVQPDASWLTELDLPFEYVSFLRVQMMEGASVSSSRLRLSEGGHGWSCWDIWTKQGPISLRSKGRGPCIGSRSWLNREVSL